MGIKGLGGYVLHSPVLRDIAFRRPSSPKANGGGDPPPVVVIDGTSLVCGQYFGKIEWTLGGQYHALFDRIDDFVAKLRSAGVDIGMVVFDGGRGSPAKATERLARDTRRTESIHHALRALRADPVVHLRNGVPVSSTDRSYARVFARDNVLPLLAAPLALQHLRDTLGVPVCVAPGEADGHVAAWANRLGAYAMASDSDFYVLDVHKGYIPLDSLSMADGLVQAKVFTRPVLARSLQLHPRWFPVLACALGNDYVDERVLSQRIMRVASASSFRNTTLTARVRIVADYLAKRVREAGLKRLEDEDTAGMPPAEAATPLVEEILRHLHVSPPLVVAQQAPSSTSKAALARRRKAEKKRAEKLAAAAEAGEEPDEPTNGTSVPSPTLDLLTTGMDEYTLPPLAALDPPANDPALAAQAAGRCWPGLADVFAYRVLYLPPTLEDTTLASPWELSWPLREAAYAAVGASSVTERGRHVCSDLAIGSRDRAVSPRAFLAPIDIPASCSAGLVRALACVLRADTRGEVSLDLVLATALAAARNVRLTAVPAVRYTRRGVHWVAVVEAALMSWFLHPARGSEDRAGLPAIDAAAVHHYLARIHTAVPEGVETGKAVAEVLDRYVPELTPDERDVVVATVNAAVAVAGVAEVPRRAVKLEPDEVPAPDPEPVSRRARSRSTGSAKRAKTKKNASASAASSRSRPSTPASDAADSLAELGLSHLF
ncbi:hypothetical protein H9P43_000129 [Blastocladiella emersonii ATCC 22665]|nr:hypothetical protein H9P43_000129 [Blastocladiella emersonii ATCC 22665]